jgi:hypothetical protein
MCAVMTASATCRKRVDLPPMLGPVSSMHPGASSAPKTTSLRTNAGDGTNGCQLPVSASRLAAAAPSRVSSRNTGL